MNFKWTSEDNKFVINYVVGIFIIERDLGFQAFMLHDMDFNTLLSCDFENFDGEEEAKFNDTCVTND